MFATGADSSEPAIPRQQAAPAISLFVIDKSLSGQVQDIKERTLKVEVFDREIHYDLSNDPIVRVAAGDIRKRLAQDHVRVGYERVERDQERVGAAGGHISY